MYWTQPGNTCFAGVTWLRYQPCGNVNLRRYDKTRGRDEHKQLALPYMARREKRIARKVVSQQISGMADYRNYLDINTVSLSFSSAIGFAVRGRERSHMRLVAKITRVTLRMPSIHGRKSRRLPCSITFLWAPEENLPIADNTWHQPMGYARRLELGLRIRDFKLASIMHEETPARSQWHGAVETQFHLASVHRGYNCTISGKANQ